MCSKGRGTRAEVGGVGSALCGGCSWQGAWHLPGVLLSRHDYLIGLLIAGLALVRVVYLIGLSSGCTPGARSSAALLLGQIGLLVHGRSDLDLPERAQRDRAPCAVSCGSSRG